jgi:hypothetical protein
MILRRHNPTEPIPADRLSDEPLETDLLEVRRWIILAGKIADLSGRYACDARAAATTERRLAAVNRAWKLRHRAVCISGEILSRVRHLQTRLGRIVRPGDRPAGPAVIELLTGAETAAWALAARLSKGFIKP